MKTLKLILITFSLLLIFQGAQAQHKRPTGKQFEFKYMAGSSKYKTMRNIGIGMTVGGGAVIIAGIAYNSPKIANFKFDGEYDLKAVQSSTWLTTGVAIAAAGIVVAGAITWSVGSIKMKHGKYAELNMGYSRDGLTCYLKL